MPPTNLPSNTSERRTAACRHLLRTWQEPGRPLEMNADLAEHLRRALDGGCSLEALEKLEAILVGEGGGDEQAAAAWLYAWAYDAIRPHVTVTGARVPQG